MATAAPGVTRVAPWQRVMTGDDVVAVAERDALGTTARVAVWPPENLAVACAAVDDVLGALDQQASRFRADSELSWLHGAGGGLFMLSDGLAEAVGVALAAARWTGGRTDPTVHDALISLGYDRDFAAIDSQRGEPPAAPAPVPGWRRVRLHGPLLHLPAGVRIDLGATAKGVGSDRAVRAVMAVTGHAGGVLVSLGGDIAVGGTPPREGWPVTVAERAGPGRLAALAAGPAGQRCGRDLVSDLPAVATRGRGAAPHRGPADRAARGRAVAYGERGGGDLRRRKRRDDGGDRGGPASGGLADRGGPAGPAGRS